MLSDAETRHRVLDMLHAADLGITDAKTQRIPPELAERAQKAIAALNSSESGEEPFSVELQKDSLMRIILSHEGVNDSVDFEVSEESLGTLVWLGLIGPVLDALANGAVLLADELESSLHPSLVAQLVLIFQSPTSNPNGAQLIFNSHETSLLGNSVDERVLGRDQVWFTEKLHDGRTRLYPLTDLAPRPAEAISKRYLTGRYGAVPIISPEEFSALAENVSSGDAQLLLRQVALEK
jgi:AAA15 family ATPase/GTPase